MDSLQVAIMRARSITFPVRYSNRVRLGVDDVERTARTLKGIVGKRLTYRGTDRTTPA